jgi:hypothetical protein
MFKVYEHRTPQIQTSYLSFEVYICLSHMNANILYVTTNRPCCESTVLRMDRFANRPRVISINYFNYLSVIKTTIFGREETTLVSSSVMA